ncbi:MAG: type II toxin-antitoxin system VapC family toxin [Arcobacter sp.]|jgi:hypothetical protein|uniref:type II toxin-antitoxin system VapC family toxin n=1 Tax=Arcobacter sp. TaxID=1872629 RepID=UPI003D044C7C
MVMVFLDSNTIIYLSKGFVEVDEIFTDGEECGISIITYMEVLGYEFETSKEKAIIEELLSYMNIVYIDEAIAKKVIQIKQKNKIKLPDAIICATTMIHNGTLITNDVRLQNIKNLKVKIIGMRSK